jgi:hypothetical protein
MEKKVFKILFYFLKMDKNKCPKIFLKKSFKKRGSFAFFTILTISFELFLHID